MKRRNFIKGTGAAGLVTLISPIKYDDQVAEDHVNVIGKGPTKFVKLGNQIQLKELFGNLCGNNGEEAGLRQIDGLFLLSTSLGRFEWKDFNLQESEFTDNKTKLVWTTADGAIKIQSKFTTCAKTGVISRQDTVTNVGQNAFTVNRALPRFTFSCGEYELYIQQSRWGHESQGKWVPLFAGSVVLSSKWGRSTEGSAPYCCIREKNSANGVVFHIIPLGNWMIRVCARSHSNKLPYAVVELGLSDEDLSIALSSGEELRLPEILMQSLPDGDPRLAAPRLHDYLNSRLPAPRLPYPVIYNTWLDRLGDIRLDNLRKQLATASEIGCETFVIDAGWYLSTGDWRETSAKAFFGGMKDFANETRAAGLDFGLWIEPETFSSREVPVVKEHPEWFIPSASGSFRIDLSREDARRYQYGVLSRLIETYDLKYIKFDFNLELGIDQSGHELHDYFGQWFTILDDLRKNYPGTFFENCSSGAMRLDLASHFHYDAHFPSDSANPMDVIRISQGTFLRALPGRLMRWAVMKSVSPNESGEIKMPTVVTPLAATWGTYESASVDFVMAACSMGMLGLSGDIAGLSSADKRRIVWYTDFYKQYREDIVTSAGYILTPIKPMTQRDGWIAFQLCSRRRNLSLIYVYYLPNDGQSSTRLKLFEIDGNMEYKISLRSPDGVVSDLIRGKDIVGQGLEVSFSYAQHGHYSAAIYTVER